MFKWVLVVLIFSISILLVWNSEGIGSNIPHRVKVSDDKSLKNKIPTTQQINELKKLGKNIKVNWNKENATPIFLKGELGKINKGLSPVTASLNFIKSHKVLFKLNNPETELKVHSEIIDDLGFTHVKFNQVVEGISVWGSQLGVHINESGNIYCINGQYHPTIEITTNPSIAVSNAKDIAIAEHALAEIRPLKSEANLVIIHHENEYKLCWNVQVLGINHPDIYWQYFVDAVNGSVVFKYNDIHFDGPAVGTGLSQDGNYYYINTYFENGYYKLIDASKTMYTPPIGNRKGVIITKTALFDSLGSETYDPLDYFDLNGDNVFDDLYFYSAGVDAHFNFSSIYDFMLTNYNRNSWDGLGATNIINVNYGTMYANAFWHGGLEQFYFGSGNLFFQYFSYPYDIAMHEYIHAVNSSTANLQYYGQSGALSESFSDVFACIFETSNWTIGEAICGLEPGYFRNLENPHLGYPPDLYSFGAQPMVMSEFDSLAIITGDDNGGVHRNSGIPNHAAYLVASQIGRQKMGKIYYRALTNYLGPTSNFLHAYFSIWQSAIDLYGVSTEMAAVEYAFDSVGIMPGATDWNLRYDDGSPEFSYWWEEANRGLAGEFYLPGLSKVETVSFYLFGDNVGGDASFIFKIYEDNNGEPYETPLFSAPATVFGVMPGWINFDLSSQGITLRDKMYVALFYDGINQPQLGVDTTSSWLSWYYNGVNWVPDNAVYFIRATVSTISIICGDADGSGPLDISDAIYIINYIFGGGPAPVSLEAGDADCSGTLDISDAIYIINYIFGGGPAPCAVCP